jgi:hypothetical protein
MGRITAVQGFRQTKCAKRRACCWQAARPHFPAFVLEGATSLDTTFSFVASAAGVRQSSKIGMSVKAIRYGVLVERGKKKFEAEVSGCPSRCISDSFSGQFAAVVELNVSLAGAIFREAWNKAIVAEALRHAIANGFSSDAVEQRRQFVRHWTLPASGRIKRQVAVRLGPLSLVPP